jgi:hypothetical protein
VVGKPAGEAGGVEMLQQQEALAGWNEELVRLALGGLVEPRSRRHGRL